jgi:uncharacterized protein
VIPRSQLTKIADAHGVDAKTVERDYVLTHIIAAVGRHSADEGLVFKGGTALRLCYFEDYRYSADLDFSLVAGAERQSTLEAIEQALASVVEQIELPSLALAANGEGVEYEGPLGRPRSVKLDIAADELVEDTTSRPLITRYGDQSVGEIHAYTLKEIAAEKLRCVIQRLQARDLFDLNELLGLSEIDLEELWPSFERKTRHKDFDPSKFRERFEERVPQWRELWDAEMAEHLPGEPDHFEAVERAVRRALRPHLTSR